MNYFNPRQKSSIAWFQKARLGAFIHWGHASQKGWELSWPMAGGTPNLPFCQDIPVEEYHRGALEFNPTNYDPEDLARRIKRMGAGYAVITAKHHDGFSMYPTRLSAWSIANSAYGKDIVGPFIKAARSTGLKVGIYFSLIDWHHPDYPPFTDRDKPYNPLRRILSRPPRKTWERYLSFMFGQVEELLTWYGKIDLIWFDGQWERGARDWKAKELERLVRSLQPGILINNRLPGCGDFRTPEQFIPHKPPRKAWETCMTMNESWGYNPSDTIYKSSHQLVHTLCEVVGKGGNFLLNLSPRGDGSLPPEQIKRMDDLSSWMDLHSESILGTKPGLAPWQFYGPSTRKGKIIYLHLLYKPYESITVRGLPIRKVKRAFLLSHKQELPISTRIKIIDQVIGNPWARGEVTIEIPEGANHPLSTVIALEMK